MVQDAIKALKVQDYDAYIELARKVVGTPNADAFWEGLATSHPNELNFLDVVSAWPRNKLFSSNKVLAPVLSRLKSFSSSDFQKLVEFVASTDEAVFFSPVLAERVAQTPALALEYRDSLATTPQESWKTAQVWATSFVSGAPVKAAEYIIEYFHRKGRLAKAERLVLLSFDEQTVAQHAGLSEVAEQIVDMVLRADELDDYSWLVVVKLALSSAYASDVLMRAVDAENLKAVRALAGALTRLKEAEFGARRLPLHEVISLFIKGSAADLDAINQADRAIAVLIGRENTRQVAVDFLLSLGAQKQNIVEIFQTAFNTAYENSADFSHVLTAWLLTPLANTKAISSLLSMYNINSGDARLDDELMLAADEKSVTRVVRRILALSFNGATLCSFASEILRIEGLGKLGLKLGEGMLAEIFGEYPRGTEDFLAEKIKTLDKKAPSTKVYEHVYANILKWREQLMTLPHVPELSLSDRERYAVRQVKARWHRDIQKDAEANSVFAPIFSSRNTIIQGDRVATYGNFGPPVITPLEGVEHSIELPSSELSDPMGGALRRYRLLEEE